MTLFDIMLRSDRARSVAVDPGAVARMLHMAGVAGAGDLTERSLSRTPDIGNRAIVSLALALADEVVRLQRTVAAVQRIADESRSLP